MWRICFHWTAGGYTPNATDKEHYHFPIDGEGIVHKGKWPVKANKPPLRPGQYAAHAGGGNSWTIGIGLCSMLGYKGPTSQGAYPLTRKQFEAGCKLAAELCKEYGIEVTPDTVFTHFEFGQKNPRTSSAGKIDITFLPFNPSIKPSEVGWYMRNKVSWYLSKLNAPVVQPEE